MAAESFYKKLIIADKYKPDSVLSRPVLLITASSRHNNQDAIGADYGLGKVGVCVMAVALLKRTLLMEIRRLREFR